MTVFIFIAIALTIGVMLVVAMVSPKKPMIITSEVVIAKPKEEVFRYVKLLRNQENYNTWIKQDPNIKMEYKGTDGTVGFVAAWESKTRMGNGEQEILAVHDGEGYEVILRFRNHDNTTQSRTSLESMQENKTKVTTVMTATPAFPMSMMVPMMRKMLKKDLDINSANLKKVLEG